MDSRVLLAGLSHQTNTFVCGRTTLEDFEVRRGEEVLRAEDGIAPVSGVLGIAREEDWEIVPVVDLRAIPGPTVADAVVDLFWAEFRAVVDAEMKDGLDGVFLFLHGSMVSESLVDVEGEILRRIRGIEQLSDVPICGVLDPNANFTEAMARQSDGFIAYRENPPTDVEDAARDAALLLDRLMQTEDRPATLWEHPPIMWPPAGAVTDSEPMLVLEERAREAEVRDPGLLVTNVFAGFPYSDVPEAGVSFSAVSLGDLEVARAALREQNVLASSMREAGNRIGMPLHETMLRLEEHREGPVLLVEPSDDVGAGAPGDDTRLLRALIEREVRNAGAILDDAETVRYLQGSLPGTHHELTVGGKGGVIGSEPLLMEAELVSISDGRFKSEEGGRLASSFGTEIDMGPCAVVRLKGVTVLLTSCRVPPVDLRQWRSQGVDPEELFVICVKSSVDYRRAYEPIAKACYVVDLPGPCTEDLRRLPFERVGRPIYPLDEM